jgi:uncharacterized protein (DUF305 family)
MFLFTLRRRLTVALSLAITLGAVTAGHAATKTTRSLPEANFISLNASAMNKMMAGMAVKPSGDVDHDFTAMMIPHHQGAIDMAEAELQYGHNEQLRGIAQEIVVEQQQEIIAKQPPCQ